MSEHKQIRPAQRSKPIKLSTVISISLVLLTLGLLSLILVDAKNLSGYVKEHLVLHVMLKESAEEADISTLQQQINNHPYVLKTQYVNKDVAGKKLAQELGEDFIGFLGYNPLLSSIDVFMKAEFANDDNIASLSNLLSRKKNVKEVVYQRSLIHLVNKNIRIISLFMISLAALLTVVAIALINNAIRLVIYSQRFLIKSMQLVGATKNFIRAPFLQYGIVHGLLAGLLAIILLSLVLYFAKREVPELVVMLNWGELGLVFAAILVLGVFITGLSTYFAVNKFLRFKNNNFYQ